MKNTFTYVLLIFALLVPNTYHLFEGALQWDVLVSGSFLSSFLLSLALYCHAKNTKIKALSLLSGMMFLMFSINVWLVGFGNLYTEIAITDFVIVSIWLIKQILIIEPDSDEFNPENYMFFLSKVNGFITAFNSIRLGVWGMYGGRCMVAGKDVYLVRKNKFQKISYKMFKNSKNLNNYVVIDSGVKVNEKQNKKMDKLLEQDFIPLIQDCREFTSGRSLDMILLRKQLSQFFRRK